MKQKLKIEIYMADNEKYIVEYNGSNKSKHILAFDTIQQVKDEVQYLVSTRDEKSFFYFGEEES